MVSLISKLRRMLQHWPEDAVDPAPMLAAVLRELGQGLRQAAHRPPDGALRGPFGDDYRCQAFWLRLRHFCWSYLECQRWLERLARHDGQEWPAPPRHSSLTSHTDGLEAAYNGGVPSSA